MFGVFINYKFTEVIKLRGSDLSSIMDAHIVKPFMYNIRMIIKTILLVLFMACNLLAQSSIKDRILNIDGLIISESPAQEGFSACYKIMVKQPINHADTTQGFFYQKVFLSHKSIDKPMVMNINGYISFSNKISDCAKILETNQIYIEHRYFGESKPDSIDYEYLHISNAAKDLHRIKEIFGEIYKKGWISTGISKGGLTALSYRYYYPNDVDATIALSTSVKTSKCDSSFFHKIDNLNDSYGCGQDLKKFQELLLKQKTAILPHLEEHLQNNAKGYSRLGLTTIYEIAVLEIPFSIWQNGTGCNSIDFSKTDPKDLFEEMNDCLYGWFMTDDVFRQIDPYHFQAISEFGYYCYPVSRFENLLETELDKLIPVQPVLGVEANYSNEPMSKIKEWAQNSGNKIIYISGANDPYSLHRIIPNQNLDSKSYLLKGKNHNQVQGNQLDKTNLDEITNTIKIWIKDKSDL